MPSSCNPIGDGWNTGTTLFDKNSRVVSSTNDNGVTYTSYYDAANRTTETRDAVGNRTLYTYNANGATEQVDYIETNGLNGASEPSHVSYILNRSDVAWEVRDRRWSTSFDTSGYTKRDGWGRVTVSTDAAGNTVSTNYDLLSRVTDSIEEAGTDDIHTMFEYDDDGRTLTRAIKRNPGDTTYQETEYVYDERSRLITLHRPDGDRWNFRYDVNGNRIGWDDPLGTTVTDTYDARNLIAYRNIVCGTGIVGTDYETYEFDGRGLLIACSNYADGELITASAWEYNTLSLAERHHQTVTDGNGTTLGTWTTGAEFDATGFNTATLYSDGRRIEHLKDQLDRLLGSYDVTDNNYVANYVYAGPGRLVERTYGNGTRSSYSYEASGCGCGGATQFCERVEHTHLADSTNLWATERRYDKRGLVTAESSDHDGNLGWVYRYDQAERLTSTFYGVDLYDNAGNNNNLTDMADPANTPDDFAIRRNYNLDPRGNRAGSDGVEDLDDGSGSIKDYSYTVNADTNHYSAVDGGSYTFDAIEQMTARPDATYNTLIYDYKGNIVGDTISAGGATHHYQRDCQGRVLCEATDDPNDGTKHATVTLNTCAGPGGCSCSGGSGSADTKQEDVWYAWDGDSLEYFGLIQYIWGMGMMSPGSSGTLHPATAGFPSLGSLPGNMIVAELRNCVGEEFAHSVYRHENQHGSLIGETAYADDMPENVKAGDRVFEYDYTEQGLTMDRPILVDGRAGKLLSVSADGLGTTSVTFADDLPPVDLLAAEIRVASPGAAGNRLLFSNVSGTAGSPTNTLLFSDPSEYIYDILDAGGGFTVLPFYEDYWGGTWDTVTYNGVSGRTELTGSFGLEMVSLGETVHLGDIVVANLLQPVPLHISVLDINNPGDDTLEVEGDITAFVSAGDRFRIHQQSPYKYDFSDELKQGPCDWGARYTWSGYRRMPWHWSRAGEDPYHTWNRWYLPGIGRWTSPDASDIWMSSLVEYCDGNPVAGRDGSGLETVSIPKKGMFTFRTIDTSWGVTLHQGNGWGGVAIPLAPATYHFQLDFDQSSEACPKCEGTIGIVQMVRIRYDFKVSTTRGRAGAKSVFPTSKGWAIDTLGENDPYGGAMGTQSANFAQIDDQPQQTNVDDAMLLGERVATKVDLDFWDCAICASSRIFYGCVKFRITFWAIGTPIDSPYLIKPSLGSELQLAEEHAKYWNEYEEVKAWNEGVTDKTKKLPTDLN